MAGVLAISLSPALDVSAQTGHIQAVHKVRTTGQMLHPGGGGVNVARVVHNLGGSVELIYACGGPTGAILEEQIGQCGFRTHKFRSDADVRISFAVFETDTGLEYRFVPEAVEMKPQVFRSILKKISRTGADYVVASGSLPKDLPVSAFCEIADAAMKAGARFVLDTSGLPLARALESHKVWAAKPSIGELEQIAKRELDEFDAIDFAKELVASRAATYLAVSLGRNGAILAGRNTLIRLPGLRVKERSATGAGDSFVGGLIYALSQGEPIKRAFAWAAAAGTAAVMTAGTELCDVSDVQHLLRQLDESSA